MNISYTLGGIIINAPMYVLYAMGIVLIWSLLFKTFPRKVILGLWGLLMLVYSSPVPITLINALEQEARVMAPAQLPDDFEGFVLLGGCFSLAYAQMNDDRPVYNAAGSRIFDFILLAKAWPTKRIVLTGTPVEAEQMKQELIRFGVDEARITTEGQSCNTKDNATKTFALVQPQGKWVLVTSAFHMKRSVVLFERAGWSVIPWPVGFLTGKKVFTSWCASSVNGLAWAVASKEYVGAWHLGILGRRA